VANVISFQSSMSDQDEVCLTSSPSWRQEAQAVIQDVQDAVKDIGVANIKEVTDMFLASYI
jgi:hypothetical protein